MLTRSRYGKRRVAKGVALKFIDSKMVKFCSYEFRSYLKEIKVVSVPCYISQRWHCAYTDAQTAD